MPVGVIVNCLSVFFGGAVGAAIASKISQNLQQLPILFGYCAVGIGVNSLIKANSMTPVVLAVLTGYILGQAVGLEQKTSRFFHWLVKALHLGGKNIDMEFYITAVALFCCSGFGWYATLNEAIAGDPGILFSKSVLDFFTALVFAATLGKALCAIPLPQGVILLLVFGAGRLLAPWVSPAMLADLTACGGVLTLAAALRVAKIKIFPVVDLMPALVLVMPFSALWTAFMG